jgi:hypothetical protein
MSDEPDLGRADKLADALGSFFGLSLVTLLGVGALLIVGVLIFLVVRWLVG